MLLQKLASAVCEHARTKLARIFSADPALNRLVKKTLSRMYSSGRAQYIPSKLPEFVSVKNQQGGLFPPGSDKIFIPKNKADGFNRPTVEHEIRHSSDPHLKSKLRAMAHLGGSDSVRAEEIVGRQILREEARALAGLSPGSLARNNLAYYLRMIRSEVPGLRGALPEKMHRFNAAGGLTAAGEAAKSYLRF